MRGRAAKEQPCIAGNRLLQMVAAADKGRVDRVQLVKPGSFAELAADPSRVIAEANLLLASLKAPWHAKRIKGAVYIVRDGGR